MPTVRERAAKIFASGLARRQDVVAAYQKALQRKGDRDRGKAVFKTHCSSCHRLEGVGQQVGADLAAIRDRGREAVLLNILDPNREVKPQFLSYVLVTTSGRVLTGMITAETANSLTIRKPDGVEETVLRLEIDELREHRPLVHAGGPGEAGRRRGDGGPARVFDAHRSNRDGLLWKKGSGTVKSNRFLTPFP